MIALNKERLKSTAMQVKQCWGFSERGEDVFTWRINRIKNLQKNRCYTNTNKQLHQSLTIFTITRKSNFYEVTIEIDYYGDIYSYISYDDGVLSNPIKANSNNEGVYKVRFMDNDINVSRNKFLQTERLVLIFKCETKSYFSTVSLLPSMGKDIYNSKAMEMFLIELKHYASSFENFTVNVRGQSISANKAILAARSDYLRLFIQDNYSDIEAGNIKLDASYETFYAVKLFMYTGKFKLKFVKNINQTVSLIEKLRLSKLEILYKRYLNRTNDTN